MMLVTAFDGLMDTTHAWMFDTHDALCHSLCALTDPGPPPPDARPNRRPCSAPLSPADLRAALSEEDARRVEQAVACAAQQLFGGAAAAQGGGLARFGCLPPCLLHGAASTACVASDALLPGAAAPLTVRAFASCSRRARG